MTNPEMISELSSRKVENRHRMKDAIWTQLEDKYGVRKAYDMVLARGIWLNKIRLQASGVNL